MTKTGPNTPKILMISPVFYPFPPVWPEGIVNAKLATAMKKAGWHIDIIVAGYSGGTSRYPADATVSQDLADHIHIIKREPPKSSLLKRITNGISGFRLTGKFVRHLDWNLSALQTAVELNHKVNYDLILSRAIPDYAHFAALLIHRQTGIPWIANWNDPTPNHKFPPPYGQGPFSPLASNLQKWYEAVCTYCPWHTFPSERLRKYMASYLPGQIENKSSVIPHIATEQPQVPSSQDDTFSLCYAGSVLPPRDVNVFFEGIKRFASSLTNGAKFSVRFLVDKPEIVADCSKKMGIEDIIRIENSVPYSQMPEFLSKSNVLVIIEAPLEEGIFMASKIVDYAQMRRPILALSPVKGTIVDLLKQHGGGIAVDCQSPDETEKALKELYSGWKSGRINQDFRSDGLLDLFSEKNILKQYQGLINCLKT